MSNVDIKPDGQQIERLLLKIEQRRHREGWDQPASAWMLCATQSQSASAALREIAAEADCGPAVISRDLMGVAFVPTWLLNGISGNGCHAIIALAGALTSANPGQSFATAATRRTLKRMLRIPGVFGLALTCESYMFGGSEEEIRHARDNYRSFGDTPGAKECRNVFASIIDGREYTTIRERGQRPYIHEAADLRASGGPVMPAMHAMLCAANGLPLPDNYGGLDVWHINDKDLFGEMKG